MLNNIGGRRIIPRHDNVVVRLLQAPRITGGLLVELPVSEKRTAVVWAEVIEAGPGPSYRRSCSKCERPFETYADDALRPGDVVLVDSDARGDVLIHDGEEVRIMRMAEIGAVIDAAVVRDGRVELPGAAE
jgi:co-chaperonin GroES (HSP10)